MIQQAYSAVALQQVASITNIKPENGYIISAVKLVSGPPSKFLVTASAALEFVARAFLLAVSYIPLRFFSQKKLANMTETTKSAAKTIANALVAQATVRASKKGKSPAVTKAWLDKLYGAAASMKEKGNELVEAAWEHKKPLLFTATTVFLIAVFSYYGLSGNSSDNLNGLEDTIIDDGTCSYNGFGNIPSPGQLLAVPTGLMGATVLTLAALFCSCGGANQTPPTNNQQTTYTDDSSSDEESPPPTDNPPPFRGNPPPTDNPPTPPPRDNLPPVPRNDIVDDNKIISRCNDPLEWITESLNLNKEDLLKALREYNTLPPEDLPPPPPPSDLPPLPPPTNGIELLSINGEQVHPPRNDPDEWLTKSLGLSIGSLAAALREYKAQLDAGEDDQVPTTSSTNPFSAWKTDPEINQLMAELVESV